MKWLFLTKHNHVVGGLQSRSRELARALLESGHEVFFVCFGFDVFADIREDYPAQSLLQPAPAIDTRSLTPGSLLQAWRLLSKLGPDVIFFCNVGIPDFFPFTVLARVAGVRHVVAHHGANAAVPGQASEWRSLRNLRSSFGLWRRRFLAKSRIACRGITLALFNSSAQRDGFVQSYGYDVARCELWWPPIDLERFHPNSAARERIRRQLCIEHDFAAVGVGRLGRQKAFDVAIRALPLVLRRHQDARLLLIGEGEHDTALRLLASSLGLDDRVRFLGRSSNLPEILNAADLLLVTATDLDETLGIVIFEAMASGIPCIVTDLPGPKRAAGDGQYAIVVPRGDHHALANAINDLRNDPAQYAELARKGIVRAGECDRRRVAKRLEDWLLRNDRGLNTRTAVTRLTEPSQDGACA